MIGTESQSLMTVRENVHHMVDLLPDESLDDALDYLAEICEPEHGLSAETQAGIAEGLRRYCLAGGRLRLPNPVGAVPVLDSRQEIGCREHSTE